MKYRQLGTGGPEVSVIALGSWQTIGQSLDATASHRLVHEALELGINFFDTADIYGEGDSERALGRAMSGIPRDRYVVASKCYFPTRESGGQGGLSRRHILRSVESSLSNLRVDTLDLMQCHRFDPETPLEETIDAFEELIRSGKLRHWGVSRWTAEQMRAATRYCETSGAARPISNQYFYNLFSRDIELEIVGEAQRSGWGVIAYSPLAQGILSGKYAEGSIPEGSRADNPELRRTMWDFEDRKILAASALASLAAEYQVSAPQLALAWCLRLSAVSSVIMGASSPAQIRENVEAASIEMSTELADLIEKLVRGECKAE